LQIIGVLSRPQQGTEVPCSPGYGNVKFRFYSNPLRIIGRIAGARIVQLDTGLGPWDLPPRSLRSVSAKSAVQAVSAITRNILDRRERRDIRGDRWEKRTGGVWKRRARFGNKRWMGQRLSDSPDSSPADRI